MLELDFRAVKFCSSLDGIWTHTIVTLQHHSLSLTSSALDHSTTSTPVYIYIYIYTSCSKGYYTRVFANNSVHLKSVIPEYIYKMILLKLLHIYSNICHIMVAVINWHYTSLLSFHISSVNMIWARQFTSSRRFYILFKSRKCACDYIIFSG